MDHLSQLGIVESLVNALLKFFREAKQMVYIPDADTVIVNQGSSSCDSIALRQELRPAKYWG